MRQLHSAVTALNQQAFDTLSYGMSGDLKSRYSRMLDVSMDRNGVIWGKRLV
ncbi:hypothetical protein [Methylocucumis oryzae]|uniref:hypothetical protein n=1 Tax=Methylocucumis oryzae TaxID=1632867 RepID=UPI0012FF01B7|nr:hypothetical protein [Methylocucumis oryzae]